MRHDLHSSTAARRYATAHDAHYGSNDLGNALRLYGDIVTAHPDSAEAGYSRSQIQNIVRGVVPKEELFAAQAALALSHLADANHKEGAEGSSESPLPESSR